MREGKWQGKRPGKPPGKPYGKPHGKPGGPYRGRRPAPRERQGDASTDVILYGWHTVTAALANPARHIRRLLATENALRRLAEDGITLRITPEMVRPDAIAARLTPDAVHQGLLAEADPLPSPGIEDYGPVRHRARARPDHRSAQCGSDHAHRRSLRRRGHRHHCAPQSGSDRRPRQVGLRRARTGADRHRAKSRARARRIEGARLSHRRTRLERAGRSLSDEAFMRRWRWCSAPKAKDCGI